MISVVQLFQFSAAAFNNSTAPQSVSMLVNSTGDEPDATVGDNRCDTDGNPANGDQCTLRAAIQETNFTAANAIDFNLPANSTILLNSALDGLTGMTMRGPGSGLLTIERNPAPGTPHFRIFTVTAPAAVLMTGLTVTNGRAPDGTVSPNGAPFRSDAGDVSITRQPRGRNVYGEGFCTGTR